MIKIPSPLNLAKWLDANEDKLKPPIGNYMLQVGNGTQVMAVGGPNARTDFHINETEVGRANPCYHFSEVILFCSL
jgi:3-hydroxyanthranilate 3,4-dioxygenase